MEMAEADPDALVLRGFAPSTFTQTAALCLAWKDLPFALVSPDLGTSVLHPFGKVPILLHGNRIIRESLAIAIYVDENFDGPSLLPREPGARIRTLEWIGYFLDVFAESILDAIVRERIVKPMFGDLPDEARIAAALPAAKAALQVMDDTLRRRTYLATAFPCAPDFYLAPVIFYLARTSDGKGMLKSFGAIARWMEHLSRYPFIGIHCPQSLGCEIATGACR